MNPLSCATFELELFIATNRERVWEAIARESHLWWPRDFVTSNRTQRFVIEAKLGGRVFEDFGDGDGLVWYTVIGIDSGRELTLAGHLLPPFGGPATTSLILTLEDHPKATLLRIRDHRFGAIGGSPIEGWRQVFEDGLRSYLEGIHPG
ncbi:MAG: SRPBCC domain-containing protein [Pirellulales bacterium]